MSTRFVYTKWNLVADGVEPYGTVYYVNRSTKDDPFVATDYEIRSYSGLEGTEFYVAPSGSYTQDVIQKASKYKYLIVYPLGHPNNSKYLYEAPNKTEQYSWNRISGLYFLTDVLSSETENRTPILKYAIKLGKGTTNLGKISFNYEHSQGEFDNSYVVLDGSDDPAAQGISVKQNDTLTPEDTYTLEITPGSSNTMGGNIRYKIEYRYDSGSFAPLMLADGTDTTASTNPQFVMPVLPEGTKKIEFRVTTIDDWGFSQVSPVSDSYAISSLKGYVGINGKARKVDKLYVGVNGKARQVVKGYIGVNGKARRFL